MELRLSEVLSALSHALDITEGQPRGHAERTCLIGMRLGAELGLEQAELSSLFYALLLKDAGCSSNSAKVASLYANADGSVKRDRKITDHLRPGESLRHLMRNVAPGQSPLAKARHIRELVANGSEGARALTALRCERGADVARKVGMGEATAEAIAALDEHWDGRGYPVGVAGEEIPLLGRILCLAQTAEVFWQLGGADGACAVARGRRGAWFDPALADALCRFAHDDEFWLSLEQPDVAVWEPVDRVETVDETRLDRVAEAFATVVDAKSPYTAAHSEGVARIAAALAALLELDDRGRRDLYRAGLLHDIGKLGISNRILDKRGPLDEEEWREVRRHPLTSIQILRRVRPLENVARLSGLHHERLDGSGYHMGLDGGELDLPARVLAVADVAEALSAERPYRESLAPDEVLTIMSREVGSKLDPDVFEALVSLVEDGVQRVEGWVGLVRVNGNFSSPVASVARSGGALRETRTPDGARPAPM
jgi:HD-GYP domain-containing protein (c-di-GMP phosphodiesterase class II)